MNQGLEALVADASVAAKWHLPDETDAGKALALLQQFHDGIIELIAPTHILYEVPAAITVASRGPSPRLTAEQAEAAIEAFLEIGLPTIHSTGLLKAAYALAQRLDIAFYDANYVAVARELGIPLIVADGKLYLRIHGSIATPWLANWPPATSLSIPPP
ncbi:MAG: type II toxin-antitoxin system VapC family toxin [Dehalococcoidia bacterium]